MHEHGLAIMEPSGPTLVELGRAGGFNAAWAVAISGQYAYIADASGRLGVVSIADPSNPTLVAELDVEGSPQSIAISGDRAFIAAAAGGLSIVDISEPTAPVMKKRVDTGGSALQISIDETRAYVANWNDARVYDISEPDAPTTIAIEVVKSDAASSRVLGMTGIGERVFVGEWSGLYDYRLHPARKAPHISTSDMRIDFERTPAGSIRTKLMVFNEGSAPLQLEGLKVSGNGFSLTERERLPIAPGRSLTLELSFTASSDKMHVGELLTILMTSN